MTVVSYLKLSKDVGMGCADERETHDLGGTQRTYDTARKIFRLGELPIFVGGAGSVSNSMKIIELAKSRVIGTTNYDDALKILKDAYKEVRKEEFQDAVLSHHNVTLDEYKTGNIDSEIKRAIREALDRGDRAFGVSLLIGGYDQTRKDFRIHGIVYPGCTISFRRTESIGSGYEMAETYINNVIANLNPIERDNIQRYLGARILMESTQAAWKNFGVGGRTNLVWTQGEKFFELGEKESNMLNAVLYAERKGVLKQPDVDSYFQKIIHDNAKAEDFLTELQEKVPAEELARLFWTQSLHV